MLYMFAPKMNDKIILKGSVVFASTSFPDRDGKKTRPVIVLTLPNAYGDVVVAEVVTRPRPDVLPVRDTEKAGLHEGSGVRMRLCTVSLTRNARPIGRLSNHDYALVKARVSALLM